MPDHQHLLEEPDHGALETPAYLIQHALLEAIYEQGIMIIAVPLCIARKIVEGRQS